MSNPKQPNSDDTPDENISPNTSPDLAPPHLTPAYSLFLEKLVTTRNGTGITRVELARRLKVPESRVMEAETGARPLSFLEVRAWCRALEVNLTDFTETLDALIAAVLETRQTIDRGE